VAYWQAERLEERSSKLGTRELVYGDRGRLAVKNLPGKLRERAIEFSQEYYAESNGSYIISLRPSRAMVSFEGRPSSTQPR